VLIHGFNPNTSFFCTNHYPFGLSLLVISVKRFIFITKKKHTHTQFYFELCLTKKQANTCTPSLILYGPCCSCIFISCVSFNIYFLFKNISIFVFFSNLFSFVSKTHISVSFLAVISINLLNMTQIAITFAL